MATLNFWVKFGLYYFPLNSVCLGQEKTKFDFINEAQFVIN